MNQMSTGDQSEYLRKKMAERRSRFEQGGQFMKSGFARWAENERPARQGGAMKEAAEVVSTKAGKDILDRVKSLGEDMFAQYYKGSARHIPGRHEEDSDSEEEDMEGGVMSVGVEEYNGRGYSGNGYSGNAMPTAALGKMALGELGKMAGKVAAPMLEPCDEGWKDEGVTCSKTVPKKVKNPFKKGKGVVSDVKKALSQAVEKVKMGKGKLEEHGADLIKMGKEGKGLPPAPTGRVYGEPLRAKGKGRMDCVHHEEGEGTHVKMGKAKIPNEKAHGVKPSMATYEKQTLGKGKAEMEEASGRVESVGSGRATRAAIVKKVMKDKGLSLIEASKYVKAHGLYKK